MNCNETKVFFDELERMCDEADFRRTCPLIQKGIAVTCIHCEDYVRKNIDKAIEIVQEWSDSHPQKTLLSVFLEQYPNVVLNEDNGLPDVCAGRLYGFHSNAFCYDDCIKCWNTPIEEL